MARAWRDDALVRTAREQLTREIADNLRDVEQTAPSRATHTESLTQALQLVQDLRAARTPSSVPKTLGFGSPSFPRSAWDTAGRTGALALMDYGEVKRFSEIYDLQDLVDRVQERYVDRLTQQSAQFRAVVAGHAPGVRPDDTDLDAARVQALALRSSFQFYKELMAQLATRYKLVEPR